VLFGSPIMQPASLSETVELSLAPVWPGLLAQAASPERKAMPTTEQPEQQICLRIATLLFALQKRAYQKSGRATIVGAYPSSPAVRGAGEGRLGVQLLDGDVVIGSFPGVRAVNFEAGLNAEQIVATLQPGILAGCILEVGQQVEVGYAGRRRPVSVPT
jgi:hypothetical protein